MAPTVLNVDLIQQHVLPPGSDDTSTSKTNYGRRLLVDVVDARARRQPDRTWASIAHINAADSFINVIIKELAQAVNFMSWWMESQIGRSSSDKIDTIGYIGAPDVRYGIMFLASIKLGYKVSASTAY